MSRRTPPRAQRDRWTSMIRNEGSRIRRAILLGLVSAVPIFFLRPLNDAINIPKLALLIVGVSVVLAIRLSEAALGDRSFRWHLLFVPAGAIAAPLLLSWLLSPYKDWAFWGNYPRYLGLLPILVTIAFGLLLVDAFSGDSAPLAWAVVTSAAVVASYAIVQVVGLDPFEWSLKGADAGNVASSTLGNSNFTGGFLGIALPVLLGAALARPERRSIALVIGVLIVFGLLATRSEGGLAAGIAGAAIVGGARVSGRWHRARVASYVLAGVIAVGVIGSVVWAIADREGARVPATIARRGDWWQGAASMTADASLLGRGPSVFALEGTVYRTAEDARQAGSDFTDDPHSIVFWFLTSAGVVGALGLMVALGWLLREGARLEATNLIGVGFFGGVVAYVVQSLISIDTVSLRTAFWTVAAGMVAARAPAESAGDADKPVKGRLSTAPRPAGAAVAGIAVAIVLAIAGVWWGANLVIADARLRHASDLLAAGRGDEAVAEFDRTVSMREEPYYRRVYGRQIGSVAVSIADQGQHQVAITLFQRADRAFSYALRLPHASSVLDYARLLREWARSHPSVEERALSLYERAMELDPLNEGLREEALAAERELEEE